MIANTCNKCQIGFKSSNGNNCIACLENYIAPLRGQIFCNQCLFGSKSNQNKDRCSNTLFFNLIYSLFTRI